MSDLVERSRKMLRECGMLFQSEAEQVLNKIERLTEYNLKLMDANVRLSDKVIHLKKECEDKERVIRAGVNTAKRLQAALERYGHHLCTCSSLDKMDSGTLFHRSDWPCDCGFKEAHREAIHTQNRYVNTQSGDDD